VLREGRLPSEEVPLVGSRPVARHRASETRGSRKAPGCEADRRTGRQPRYS